jgi:hypothetical protein
MSFCAQLRLVGRMIIHSGGLSFKCFCMLIYIFIIHTGITSSFCIIGSKSRDSSVGVANSLGAGQKEFDSRQGQNIFLFSVTTRQTLEPTQPPIQWMPGTLPRVKAAGA